MRITVLYIKTLKSIRIKESMDNLRMWPSFLSKTLVPVKATISSHLDYSNKLLTGLSASTRDPYKRFPTQVIFRKPCATGHTWISYGYVLPSILKVVYLCFFSLFSWTFGLCFLKLHLCFLFYFYYCFLYTFIPKGI